MAAAEDAPGAAGRGRCRAGGLVVFLLSGGCWGVVVGGKVTSARRGAVPARCPGVKGMASGLEPVHLIRRV